MNLTNKEFIQEIKTLLKLARDKVYSESETVSWKFKLSWLHYIFLSRIKNEDKQKVKKLSQKGKKT